MVNSKYIRDPIFGHFKSKLLEDFAYILFHLSHGSFVIFYNSLQDTIFFIIVECFLKVFTDFFNESSSFKLLTNHLTTGLFFLNMYLLQYMLFATTQFR